MLKTRKKLKTAVISSVIQTRTRWRQSNPADVPSKKKYILEKNHHSNGCDEFLGIVLAGEICVSDKDEFRKTQGRVRAELPPQSKEERAAFETVGINYVFQI